MDLSIGLHVTSKSGGGGGGLKKILSQLYPIMWPISDPILVA